MISSSLLPLVYHNMIVEHLIGEGGSGVISSSPLPLVYHTPNSRTSHRGGGGSGMISSSLLPLVYHNMIVEHLIGEGGSGEWGD